MGNVSAWVAIALTGLTMVAACIAYVHMLVGGVHNRISGTRDWAETKVGEVRVELKAEIAEETAERRREYERFESILEGFRAVGTAVTRVADGVTHLGERFDDTRRSTDRALDEIKHAMRNLDMRVAALPGSDISAARVRRTKDDEHE